MKMKRKGKEKNNKWISMMKAMKQKENLRQHHWPLKGTLSKVVFLRKKLFYSCGECAQINSKMMDPRWLSPTQAQAPILLSDVKTRT